MHISKINEVYLKIEVDPSLSRELTDYFTFEVPGHRFMPAYRNKIWDGKIRLFSPATGQIYVGLLEHIKEFSANRAPRPLSYFYKIYKKSNLKNRILKEIKDNLV